jgi:hypothetical protein
MPFARFWHVWIWRFEGKKAFVFAGAEGTPAARWNKRFAFESQLNDELRKMDFEPFAEDVVSFPMHGNEARAVRRSTEKGLRDAGYKLLLARDRRTIIAGDENPPPIHVQHWGRRCWFPSIAAASKATSIPVGRLIRMARDPDCLEVAYDSCQR